MCFTIMKISSFKDDTSYNKDEEEPYQTPGADTQLSLEELSKKFKYIALIFFFLICLLQANTINNIIRNNLINIKYGVGINQWNSTNTEEVLSESMRGNYIYNHMDKSFANSQQQNNTNTTNITTNMNTANTTT
eukprot:145103_1